MDNINKVHSNLLALLDDFDSICRNNHINYSLHAGTLLGAIREKGFILWDDDADIMFLHEEYDKFVDVIHQIEKHEVLPFNYDFNSGGRLFKKCDDGEYVWLDIYVNEYISENKILQKLKFILIAIYMAWSRDDETLKITKAHRKYTGPLYCGIYLLHLLGKPFSDSAKQRVGAKIRQLFPGKRAFIHRANDQYVAMKLILPTYTMLEFVDAEFEGRKYKVSKYFDMILKSSYGNDYMTPKKHNNDIESHRVYRSMIK